MFQRGFFAILTLKPASPSTADNFTYAKAIWVRKTVRLLLVVAVVVLFVGDGLFLSSRTHHDSSSRITHAGLDSFALFIDNSKAGGGILDSPYPQAEEASTEDMVGRKRRYWIVRLGSNATYGQFLATIRDVRANSKCNVVIAEHGDIPWPTETPANLGAAFVLCGTSIGDAGFTGKLPKDETVAP